MELPSKHVRFAHTPLDYKRKEIRVLKIEQDLQLSDPIRVTLENVDLGPLVAALADCDGRVAKLKSERHDDWLFRSRALEEQIQAAHIETCQDTLNFTALSYTWGPESPTFDILVTSDHGEGWFSVRENLYNFLKMRRQQERPSFWVDQICIDQDNTDEENHQVSQMAEIYTHASAVEVWLGAG